MSRTNSLVAIAGVWFGWLALGVSPASSQRAVPPKGPAAAPEETQASKRLHKIFFREISEYKFYLGAEKTRELRLRREPILRYPTPQDWWGEMYLWTDGARPAVVGCVFGLRQPDSRRRINHEFHSLAPKPLHAAGGATGWQPEEAGITFKPVPDTPEPAKDEAARLTQMSDVANHFSAHMIRGSTEVDLKLLLKPLYRYEITDKDSSVVDGALFAYEGPGSKDPEVLLVIEAQRTDHGTRWHYAPARLTNRAAWLKYNGEEVWRVRGEAVGVSGGVTTKRYGAFFVKTVAEEAEEQ